MQKLIVSLLFSLSCLMLWGGQALREDHYRAAGRVEGRISIDEVVGKNVQSTPMSKLNIYLIKAEDSPPLLDLQHRCRQVTADPNADPLRAYNTCSQSLAQAVALVPTLPLVASAETDRDGVYSFESVPAAGRYHVVAVKKVPGAEPIVVVGVTNKVKAGERITINLSANNPWTRATTPQTLQ